MRSRLNHTPHAIGCIPRRFLESLNIKLVGLPLFSEKRLQGGENPQDAGHFCELVLQAFLSIFQVDVDTVYLTRGIGCIDMGWLRLVGSLKLQVSFAKEPYKRDDILQKRPIILRSLLILATSYELGNKRPFIHYLMRVRLFGGALCLCVYSCVSVNMCLCQREFVGARVLLCVFVSCVCACVCVCESLCL